MSSGWASAPISLRTCCLSSLRKRFARLAALERDEHGHGFALDLVGPPHGGGFGHVRMADQGAFDLDRAQPMAGDVQHVVDAAHDPVVAVGVAAGVVAGQVVVRHLAPVLLAIAVVVAPNAAQHAGPGLGHHQPAALPWRHRLARASRRSPARCPAAAWCNCPAWWRSRPAAGSS